MDEEKELTTFDPSRLGTQEHWQTHYLRELGTAREGQEDRGEVWFGSRVERRVIDYVLGHFAPTCSIVDVGCGNGSLLRKLALGGFSSLHGFDYSAASVELAQLNCTGLQPPIHLFRHDIRDARCQESVNAELFVDKGTFDALCLSHGEPGRPEDVVKSYVCMMQMFGRRGFKFIITSCNWTRDELQLLFGGLFTVIDQVEHSSFTFGGKRGQDVTTLVMAIK